MNNQQDAKALFYCFVLHNVALIAKSTTMLSGINCFETSRAAKIVVYNETSKEEPQAFSTSIAKHYP